jgi:uncharacterized protein YndB with AHSA1/START domain
VQRRAELPASAERVFALIADLDRLPSWQTGIVSAEKTTPGPIGLGGRARVQRRLGGHTLTVDIDVTGYEPGRRLVLRSEASGIQVEANLELAPLGPQRTAIGFSMEIRAANVFMVPVEGMVAGAAEADIHDSLDRLRRALAAG